MENSVKVHKSVIADKKVKIEKFPVKPDDLNCMFKQSKKSCVDIKL